MEQDVVVIGAGSAGEVLADDLAEAGLEVALIERGLVGGQCPFVACMPSKAMLRPGAMLRAASDVPGLDLSDVRIDRTAVLDRRSVVCDHWDDSGHVSSLASGVTVIRGTGRLTAPRTVAVDGDAPVTVTARRAVVLAGGTSPAIPPITGIDHVDVWTNEHATVAEDVPETLLVVGGGVVGCEMATAYADLGSRVTFVHRGPRLLEREEERAGELVARRLRDDGVDVRLSTEVSSLRAQRDAGAGAAVATLDDGDVVEIDRVLIATGRRPASGSMGVEVVGLDPDTYLDVDDRMRVTAVDGDWLYAVGDVNGRALYTHAAKYQATAATEAILAGDDTTFTATADRQALPRITFTDPQVCAVGLTSAAARDAGLDVATYDLDLAHTAAAFVHAEDLVGWTRIVVDREEQRLVGATMVGPEVAEALLAVQVAISCGGDLEALRHAIAPFPTLSEAWTVLLKRAHADLT